MKKIGASTDWSFLRVIKLDVVAPTCGKQYHYIEAYSVVLIVDRNE